MTVKFGLFVPQGWKMDLVGVGDPIAQYEAMTAVAKAADAGPWDSVWVYDHFHTVPQPTMESTFEAWTVSATLARDTERVRIGQMVAASAIAARPSTPSSPPQSMWPVTAASMPACRRRFA